MKEILRIFVVITVIWFIFFTPFFKNKLNIIKKTRIRYDYFSNIDNKKNKNIEKINFKNEKSSIRKISYNMNLTNTSGYTYEEYDIMLKGTKLEGLGKSFKKCDEIGVNSLFIIALACHESNYGNSKLAVEKNNIFGFRAYDRDPYNSAKTFSSKDECIVYVSHYIKKNYLTENGIYFNGYTISDINKKYASDKNWSNKIYSIMEKLIDKI